MSPAISVRGLRKQYGAFAAVDRVDLEVETGEILALLGPNGAGKTTTVEICEGYRTRDAGDVRVLGVDPATADREWREHVGVVLQTSGFTEELTVRETVAHFASLYERPREIDGLLDAVGLTEQAGVRARKLSGGQQRRLDVAIGVVGRPELLFLDEPTTGFDPEARRHFWDLIRRFREDGTTILLTTHYLEEAEALADRVAVIVRGRIVADSTPATLGGRDHASAIVRWVDHEGAHEVRTDTPTQVVAELSARLGGEASELTVSRPTLEDVYLQLIGATS
ncbi:MAG: ABC transporter ATP-binding protein [Actinobacteria bacterium]|nr:ABC transporter ATP-binding protein [Actinomycetota bacterium]